MPGFWPVRLAPWFWPLLLALGLALLLGLILRLAPGQHPDELRAQRSFQQSVQQQGPAALSEPVFKSVSQSVQHAQPSSPHKSSPPSSPRSSPQWQLESPPEPLLELDPLLALLAEDDPQACIASARPHPQASRLDLEMAAVYQDQPPERRQQLADHWLQRSRELGYERLRLLDRSGTVLGQAARVGSGMVLLEPSPAPQA